MRFRRSNFPRRFRKHFANFARKIFRNFLRLFATFRVFRKAPNPHRARRFARLRPRVLFSRKMLNPAREKFRKLFPIFPNRNSNRRMQRCSRRIGRKRRFFFRVNSVRFFSQNVHCGRRKIKIATRRARLSSFRAKFVARFRRISNRSVRRFF